MTDHRIDRECERAVIQCHLHFTLNDNPSLKSYIPTNAALCTFIIRLSIPSYKNQRALPSYHIPAAETVSPEHLTKLPPLLLLHKLRKFQRMAPGIEHVLI